MYKDAHRLYKAIDDSSPRAEQEKTINTHLDKCISRLEKCFSNKDVFANRLIDIAALLDLLFLDTESELAFGKSFLLQDSPSVLSTSLPKLNITFLRMELLAGYFGIASPLAFKIFHIDTEAEKASKVLEALKGSVRGSKPSSAEKGKRRAND